MNLKEIKEMIQLMNANGLTEFEMEKDGLIQRKVYVESPVRIEYHLTEKGRAMKPILEQMAVFSMRYCPRDVFKDGKPRTYQEVFSELDKL